MRWGYAKELHQCDDRPGLQRTAVVTMKDYRRGVRCDIFAQAGSTQQFLGVLSVFGFPSLVGNDFSAVQVHDNIEV